MIRVSRHWPTPRQTYHGDQRHRPAGAPRPGSAQAVPARAEQPGGQEEERFEGKDHLHDDVGRDRWEIGLHPGERDDAADYADADKEGDGGQAAIGPFPRPPGYLHGSESRLLLIYQRRAPLE